MHDTIPCPPPEFATETRHASPTPDPGRELTLRDEMDLRIYFSLALPPEPGSRSNFGPMCDRLAARNPNTKERPTPFVARPDGTTTGAAWTEILDCPARGGGGVDAEDAFVSYVDARRRFTRIRVALAQLTERAQDALRAHYACEEDAAGPLGRLNALAALTPAAIGENRARASRDRHESVEATLESLARDARDTRMPKEEREDARKVLLAVRQEAAMLLREARASYAASRRRESR